MSPSRLKAPPPALPHPPRAIPNAFLFLFLGPSNYLTPRLFLRCLSLFKASQSLEVPLHTTSVFTGYLLEVGLVSHSCTSLTPPGLPIKGKLSAPGTQGGADKLNNPLVMPRPIRVSSGLLESGSHSSHCLGQVAVDTLHGH